MAKAAIPRETVSKIVQLIANGATREDIGKSETCSTLGIDPADATRAWKAAWRMIHKGGELSAADDRALSIIRTREIANRALRQKDPRTALVAQRNLERLLDARDGGALPHGADAGDAPVNEAEAELEKIRAHLLPLNLAAADYPISGHARVAAEIIRDHLTRCKAK